MINRRILFYILISPFFVSSISIPDQKKQNSCKIHIDADREIHTMKGGIGASWHAIEEPCQGYNAGSAWGANPRLDDDEAWEELYGYADWLGLNFCRIELEQRMYQPEKDKFTFDSYEMKILYRILDWCERNSVDVFLQQMWNNVPWLLPEGVRPVSVNRLRVAPGDMKAFAEGLATMVDHLVNNKGYTCIKYVCINNEPGHSWSWWQNPDMSPMSITPGLRAVRNALDERNIDIPLSGPDWTDMPEFNREEIDFDPYIGAYDIHSYNANFDWNMDEGGYSINVAEKRIIDWRNWAHSKNKPLFISEVGTQLFGYILDDPAPGSFKSTLKDTELIIRALNLGPDAFNRWSFINRGNLDGQWQLVDTWDMDRICVRESFSPHPNSFYGIGLLTRFNAKYSTILYTEIDGDKIDGHQRIFAAALRSPSGEYTLYVINDSPEPFECDIQIDHAGQLSLYRYGINKEEHEGLSNISLIPEKINQTGNTNIKFKEVQPAKSITVYSTYRLDHTDKGIFY